MRTTTSNGWVRGFAGVAVAALLLGAGVLSCPPAAMGAIDPPGAPMAAPGSRVHPDASLFLVVPDDFSVFSGGGMPPEYSLVASLAGTPDGGTMDVVMYSQVWKHDDGHLLFAYQLENDSTTDARRANLVGFDPGIANILDCGVLDFGGDTPFDQGEILQLKLTQDSAWQLAYIFEARNTSGGMVRHLIPPGQTSKWFYAETDATAWTTSYATVQDSGQSADGIDVLVPAPEPATIVLVAAGALLTALRRRRVG